MRNTPQNEATRLVGLTLDPPSSVNLPAAFAPIFQEILIHKEMRHPGYFVAGIVPETGEQTIHHVRLRPDSKMKPLVVGRHDHADLRLLSDPKLSLRHVLVLLKTDREGSPQARLLDLRSGTGMTDERGDAHYSVATNGSVALRIADSALFVLPSNLVLDPMPDPDQAYGAISWPIPVPWFPKVEPESRLREISGESNASCSLSIVRDGTGLGRPQIQHPNARRVGILRVEFEDSVTDHDVDEIALRAGVLVGRYGRCDINTSRLELPKTVSRVHALLITFEDRIHIIDVGSKNGVEYKDFPIRTMPLPRHLPSTFQMGPDFQLTWWPT